MTKTTETPARPKELTPEMKKAAAELVAEELLTERLIEAKYLAEIIDQIAEMGSIAIDGYDLARRLEKRYGWIPSAVMVETLNGFSMFARQEIYAAQKRWAEEHRIERALPDGTRIQVDTFGGKATGVITGVYKDGAAQYLVKLDRDAERDSSRLIVDFEDCKVIES